MKTPTSDKKYTIDNLKQMSRDDVSHVVLSMQDQIEELTNNYERILELFRIEQANRFGKRSEKLETIDGQLALFDEAETTVDLDADEPTAEEVVHS